MDDEAMLKFDEAIALLGKKPISIKAKRLKDLFSLCINRSAVFMGFGIHAADRQDFIEYNLCDRNQLSTESGQAIPQLLPNIPVDDIPNLKSSFRRWIIGNGLNEFLHGYAVCLDEIYSSCLLAELANNLHDENLANNLHDENLKCKASKRNKHFRGKSSAASKLKILNDEFGIYGPLADYIQSLNLTRNCLVHNFGLVESLYCNNSEKTYLEIKWLGLSTYIKREGNKQKVPVEPGMHVKKGEVISTSWQERTKRWNVGSLVDFTAQDIYEILLLAHIDGENLAKKLETFCKDRNIKTNKEKGNTKNKETEEDTLRSLRTL